MWAKLFVVAVALVLAPQSALGQVGSPFLLPSFHPSVFQVSPFLVHHDVVVGGNPFNQHTFQDGAPNRDHDHDSAEYGWVIPQVSFDATARQWNRAGRNFRGYAPIYANIGDRLIFEYGEGDNVYRLKNHDHYVRCELQDAEEVAGDQIGGGVDKRRPNRKVITLSQSGEYYFAMRRAINDVDGVRSQDFTACDLGAKVTVFVDTPHTAEWDHLNHQVNINHVWTVGGASNRYWSSLYLSLELGFQTMHVAMYDRVDFEYDRTDDVRVVKDEHHLHKCDFKGSKRNAGPLVGGGFNKPNRYQFVVEDRGTLHFSSAGGTDRFDKSGLQASLRPGYLKSIGLFWPESCKDGKMKLTVVVVTTGARVSVPEAFPAANILGTNSFGLNDPESSFENPFLQFLQPFGFV